jgi:hypothetical protein
MGLSNIGLLVSMPKVQTCVLIGVRRMSYLLLLLDFLMVSIMSIKRLCFLVFVCTASVVAKHL